MSEKVNSLTKTYLVHAKSTGKLISFEFSDRRVQSLVSAKRSANRSPNEKNDFTFWLIFYLSPNLELSDSLSERLIQKLTWPIIAEITEKCIVQHELLDFALNFVVCKILHNYLSPCCATSMLASSAAET